MKLHTDRTDVERSGVVSETTFRIKTTAKAFDILSSGLYTDAKLAIVRELSCNALDAHIAAGQEKVPFEIHLPNRMEPWFHIRDFGTGLSDEDVMDLYTTYFDSTKTNSNAFIGALGLGSKSPFSYTKAFEVISRFNGKRRMYSAFINEDGVPSIARLGEVDCDEHNGLEVRITIQPSDFTAFSERTARALRWFPVKPTVVGVNGFQFLEVPKERLEGESWKMFETNFSNDGSKMTAVQGNVAYKVDISKLGLGYQDLRVLERAHVVGFFEIGELEVAANREEIRYDDRSKLALVEKIELVRASVLKSIEEQVDAMKDQSTWNVIIKLNSIALDIFGDRGVFREFTKDTKNQRILDYIKCHGHLQTTKLQAHELSAFQRTSGSRGTSSLKRLKYGNGIAPESYIRFFYNDLAKGGIARAMEWARTAPSINGCAPYAVVIRPMKGYVETTFNKDDNNKVLSTREWTERDYVAELQKFRTELGDVEFLLTSKDTPEIVREKQTYKKDLPIFSFAGTSGKYKQHADWVRASVDLAKGGLYFNLLNGSHVAFTNKSGDLQAVRWQVSEIKDNISEAVSLINTYLKTEYKTSDVYGIGSQAVNKINKNSKWINIFDVLKEAIKGYDDAINFFYAYDKTPDTLGVKSFTTKKEAVQRRVEDLSKKSSFRKAVLPLIEDYKKYSKYVKTIRFIKVIDLDLGTKLFDNKASPYFNDSFLRNYPMLVLTTNLEHHTSTTDLDNIFEYINLIDQI